MEVLVLCVLGLEVFLSAILCFWFSKEKRAQSQWSSCRNHLMLLINCLYIEDQVYIHRHFVILYIKCGFLFCLDCLYWSWNPCWTACGLHLICDSDREHNACGQWMSASLMWRRNRSSSSSTSASLCVTAVVGLLVQLCRSLCEGLCVWFDTLCFVISGNICSVFSANLTLQLLSHPETFTELWRVCLFQALMEI